MRYTFDLSGSGLRQFEFFPHSVAAFGIPNAISENEALSVLLWGVVFPDPEPDADFCATLPPAVQVALPTVLYLSGWAVLTFQGVHSGEAAVWPYRPTLRFRDLRLTGPSDAEPALRQTWPGPHRHDAAEYCLSTVLEQPLGFLSLKVKASGPVSLSLNPQDFVPAEQVDASPAHYGFDYTRRRILLDLASPIQG